MMPAVAEELVLADFSTGDGASWQIVNDTVMGGRSSSAFRVSEEALVFSGTLNTNGGGFASVRSGPLAVRGKAQNVVRVRVKGDGRQYQLRLYSAATGTTYRAQFDSTDDWQTIDLPLAAFEPTWRGRPLNRPPIEAADVGGLGVLLADGNDGEFSVAVAWVKLVEKD